MEGMKHMLVSPKSPSMTTSFKHRKEGPPLTFASIHIGGNTKNTPNPTEPLKQVFGSEIVKHTKSIDQQPSK
jgi:hypothetical protein